MKPTKKCSKCKTEKTLSDFCKHKRSKDGHNNVCKACVKLYMEENKEKVKKYKDAYYDANRERYIKRDRVKHLASKYGVTVEWYEEQLKKQEGKCMLCLTENPGGKLKHFHVDHNHDTGKVRSLLCHSCNTGLGFFKEDPKLLQKAIEYVNKFKQD